jgi:hypothetical protein
MFEKLSQQWFVDSLLKVEANNLNYIKTHQAEMRSVCYKSLTETVQASGSARGSRGRGNRGRGFTFTSHSTSNMNNLNQEPPVGRPVVLPSTFQGSPRNMTERCRDAMAMFAALGAPDLFITFTCNPKWKEISENLLPHEKAHDRPDLT